MIHASLLPIPQLTVDICITPEVVAQSVPNMSGSEFRRFDSGVELVNKLLHPLTCAHDPLRLQFWGLSGISS